MSTKDTTNTDLADKYATVLDEFQPYVLTTEENLDELELDDGQTGYPGTDQAMDVAVIDSYGAQAAAFSDMLIELDALAYEEDITMEKWVLQDAALEPSAVVGFGKPKDAVDDDFLDAVDVPDDYPDDGLVPYSEFAGTAKLDGSLVPHTFGVGQKQEGMGTATAVLAAELFPQDTWTAISQYDNVSPKVYSKLGEMTLEEATVPGHSLPAKSYKFAVELDDGSLEQALQGSEPEAYDLAVGMDDGELIDELDAELDDGTTYAIPQPGAVLEDGEVKLAVQEV